MTKLQKERYDIIRRLMLLRGIEFGNAVLITMWDLAGNINNTWNADKFVDSKKYKSVSTHGFVVPDHRLYDLFRGIRHGARKTDIELRISPKNKSEYLVIW